MQAKQTLRLGIAALFMAVFLAFLFFGQLAEAASSDNTFTFSSTGISVSGSGTGYEISGSDLKITAPGTYTISGTSSEGTITIQKELTDVTLILNGLNLTSAQTSPVTINKSSSVTIQVTGSNTLTDNEDPAVEDTSDTYEGAGIKAKSGSALTFTGSGTLTVNGNCNNGIKGASEASISVNGPTLTVTAANNALASDGFVTVESGTLNLTAVNDGIKAEPDEGDTASAGTVTVNGGKLNITTGGDGIQATGTVTITSGTVAIQAGGGYQETLAEDASAKGIKSTSEIVLSGGTYTLDCADDAIHSNGDVTVSGGTYTIHSGDDAIHADYILNVGIKDSTSGPSINIASSVEGFEGAIINLYSGSGDITSSDDGMNAANSDLGNNYDFSLNMYGGTWKVNASGDGLDANGDIYLYGGVVEVFGATNNGNSALDYDGICTYEGGTILAIGMSGMAMAPNTGVYLAFGNVSTMGGPGQGGMGNQGQMPPDRATAPTEQGQTDSRDQGHMGPRGQDQIPPDAQTGATTGTSTTTTSPQGSPTENAGTNTSSFTISQGDSIVIKDESGSTLYKTTGLKTANSVVFANEDIVSGSTYTLSVNGTVVATATAATGTGATANPGGMAGSDPANTSGGGNFPFRDISGSSWYYSSVRSVLEKGIMSGTSGTTFSPEAVITRGMLAQILYNLEEKPETDATAEFTDVETTAWYYDAVNWAATEDIVSGYDTSSFGPDDAVTREQLATILYRYAQYKGYAVDTLAELEEFNDSSNISSYALSAMQWANGQSLISGTDNSRLLPKGEATRAQAATILLRFVENICTTDN